MEIPISKNDDVILTRFGNFVGYDHTVVQTSVSENLGGSYSALCKIDGDESTSSWICKNRLFPTTKTKSISNYMNKKKKEFDISFDNVPNIILEMNKDFLSCGWGTSLCVKQSPFCCGMYEIGSFDNAIYLFLNILYGYSKLNADVRDFSTNMTPVMENLISSTLNFFPIDNKDNDFTFIATIRRNSVIQELAYRALKNLKWEIVKSFINANSGNKVEVFMK